MLLRCPQCRTRRVTYDSMQKHIQDSGHKLCDCGGYHYKHRLGSPYCFNNALSGLNHAMRSTDLTDEEIEDIHLDIIWHSTESTSKETDECPF